MAIGPTRLPGDRLGGRQGGLGGDPLRRAPLALQRRDADDPANGFALHLLVRGAARLGRLLFRAAIARGFILRVRCMGATAAARFALLGRATTADSLAARMGRIRRGRGQGKPDGGDEIRQQRHAGTKPTSQRPPQEFSERAEHTVKNRKINGTVHYHSRASASAKVQPSMNSLRSTYSAMVWTSC
jgi:hypothetical protein